MKKLSTLLLAVVLTFVLAGCGKEDKVTTSACTLKQDGEMEQTFTFSATNDEIDKVGLKMVFDNSMFGVESLNTFDDTQKEQIKNSMLTTLGLDKTSYEGIDLNIDIQDQMTITINTDLKKADKEVLKQLGLDFTDTDMSLERAVKDLKADGATCK